MASIFDLLTTEKCEPVGEFFIRYLSALERDKFEEHWQKYRQNKNTVFGIRGFMVAFCLSDAEGNPEFNSGDGESPTNEFVETANKIGSIPAANIQPLFSKAMEINGFSKNDVEELEKKSH